MAISKHKTKAGEVRYKAQIWKSNRVIACKTFSRKVDAEEWMKRHEIKIIDQKVGRVSGHTMTLTEFFENHYSENSGVRESTWTDYLRIFKAHLQPSFGSRKLTSVETTDWLVLFSKLKANGMSAARLNRVHATASAIYRRAIEWKCANINPLTPISYETEELHSAVFFSEEEIDRFLNYTREHTPERYLMYHFLYSTGVRISELTALMWDCIDIANKVIIIRRSFSKITGKLEVTTKSNKIRRLGISNALMRTIMELHNSRSSDFVFCKTSGEPLTYDTILKVMYSDQRAANVPKLGPHGLRHTFASHFIMKGGNPLELKELLGHSDIQTTMKYVHLTPKHLESKSSVVQWEPKKIENLVQFPGPNLFPTFNEKDEKTGI